MSVQAPVSNVSFFCPTTVATTLEFRCNATVLSGTYMDMSVDYDDGVVETFPITGLYTLVIYPAIYLTLVACVTLLRCLCPFGFLSEAVRMHNSIAT